MTEKPKTKKEKAAEKEGASQSGSKGKK